MAAARLPHEFDLIARYFAPLAAGQPGAEGLTDDTAFLDIDPAMQLVVNADAVVAGVHFLEQDPPGLIARKALRVNLSDLAGKGAKPLAYFLTAAFPSSIDEAWIAAFCAGLAADQAEFGATLMGGDTTSTPGPLTLSITALGLVPRGRAMKRNAAREGDTILVSGTLGDAALGLLVLREGLGFLPQTERQQLIERYHLPRPRCRLGPMLADSRLVHAAMDISDGLVADLGHICETSRLAAEIETQRLPLSTAAAAALEDEPALMTSILTGGDDYEILFTAPATAGTVLEHLAREYKAPITRIGRIESGKGVTVLDKAGQRRSFARGGWTHF